MARFRAFIKGHKGGSRLGDEESGIVAEITAAEVGVTVRGHVDRNDDTEVFELFLTRGRMSWPPYLLGTVRLHLNRPAFEPVTTPTTPHPTKE
jgi:hypothetical protein